MSTHPPTQAPKSNKRGAGKQEGPEKLVVPHARPVDAEDTRFVSPGSICSDRSVVKSPKQHAHPQTLSAAPSPLSSNDAGTLVDTCMHMDLQTNFN